MIKSSCFQNVFLNSKIPQTAYPGNQLVLWSNFFSPIYFIKSRNLRILQSVVLFVCNRGDTFMCQDGLRTRKLCQSPMPGHCCNSGIFRGASPRYFPYTITWKSQHVMRDTALEFGLPSGTGKLIPLLLDAGTSSCTRLPPPTDGIFPHLTDSHTCVTAQVWPMS